MLGPIEWSFGPGVAARGAGDGDVFAFEQIPGGFVGGFEGVELDREEVAGVCVGEAVRAAFGALGDGVEFWQPHSFTQFDRFVFYVV